MEFGILGSLYVKGKCRDNTPTAPKPRKVLALLLINANSMVSTDGLMQELWGEHPPASALSTLQTYIFQVRRAISQANGNDVHDRLITASLGYMLKLTSEEFDLYRFERTLVDSRAALQRGDLERASDLLHEGLALWRGPALSDVKAGPLLEIRALQLAERRLMALQLQISTDLRLGRHLELICQLVALAAEHPHHEAVHSYLMLTLHRSGRRSEALDVFHQLRTTLVEDLGIEPSSRMQELYTLVLQGNMEISRDLRSPEYFSAFRVPEQSAPSHWQRAGH